MSPSAMALAADAIPAVDQTAPISVVSLVDNPCTADSRVVRTAETLTANGYHVTVVCKSAPALPVDELVNGVRYLRVPMRARMIPRSGVFKFRAFRSFVDRTIAAIAPDIIHANDLITLPAAIAGAARLGAKVVYDVHDLYLHQPKRRSRLQMWHGRRTERRMISAADAVTTVSDGLADYLVEHYAIARPTLVMNAPTVRSGAASDLRRDAGVPDHVPLGVYTGARHSSRGLDRLVRALGMVPDVHVALVGSPSPGDAALRDIAAAGGIADRLHLLPAVPHDEVVPYISRADFGLITYNAACLNDEYSMPHKLFEAVFAGLPIVASDLRDLRRFVESTGTGTIAETLTPDGIASAIRSMLTRDRLGPATVDRIRADYGWEAQAARLLATYRAL